MKTSKPSPATYAGQATILDRTEFARLIRQQGYLTVFLHSRPDADVYMAGGCCARFEVPAKQAIELLNDGELDTLEWVLSNGGAPKVNGYTAPLAVQWQRRIEILMRRETEHEAVIAKAEQMIAAGHDAPWRVELAESRRATLAEERAEIERLRSLLAARHTQPAAA